MNNFISIYNMPFIIDLFREQESYLKSEINNLAYSDIKHEIDLGRVNITLKLKYILAPVTFGEIKLEGHRYEQKPYDMRRHIAGLGRDAYIFSFSIPVTGSEELFKYHPESGMSISSSDYGILTPDHRQALTIEVEVGSLDQIQAAKITAEKTLGMTKRLIDLNNSSTSGWNTRIGSFIDTELPKRREQLAKIYNI
jgi:hypothetical protein